MVNMLKILRAVNVILFIIGVAALGKKLKYMYIFRTAKIKDTEGFWMEMTTGLTVFFLALISYGNNKPAANFLMWIGALIYFLGGILQITARKHLFDDKTFEERLHSGFEAAQLGVYSKLRHPGKSAAALLLVGFCLSVGSYWALLLLFVLYLPSVIYRITQEERELSDTFGERWINYANDSKWIIPDIL